MEMLEIYHLEIEIDKLTNSIVNTISGDSFETEVLKVTTADLRNVTKRNGWSFNWKGQAKMEDRAVYKLTITGNSDIIQGLVSLSDNGDHFYLHLVESAPFNRKEGKLYEGVGGNLFAFACKESWDRGNEGIIAFQSKTNLIQHYQKALGAEHIGGHKMIILPEKALILIKQYFKT